MIRSRSGRGLSLFGVAVTSVVAALLVAPNGAGAAVVPPPQQDAFYRAPAGLAAAPLGAVLKSRPVQLATFAALPQKVDAWQVQYRSTDLDGRPTAAVTTLLKPAGVSRPKGVISYQIAEDASAPQCAMSYTLRLNAAPGELVNQLEVLLVDAALGAGYAVSVPDYEGFAGDYGAAEQPGYLILDGLRAAQRFPVLGLPAHAPAGIWGYSGGSLASGWAAQLQHIYAPDVPVKGVALGGFATDLAATMEQVNGGIGGGLLPSALPGILRSSPALAAVFDRYLTPAGKALLVQSGTQCETANLTQHLLFNINLYLTIPLTQLLTLPAAKAAFDAIDLGNTAPTVPLFVYHAVNDELVPIATTDAIVARYCAGGTRVTYTRDLLSEHVVLAETGGSAALAWLNDRLSGQPALAGCNTSTVATMAVTPGGLAQLPNVARSALAGLAGLPIGPLL